MMNFATVAASLLLALPATALAAAAAEPGRGLSMAVWLLLLPPMLALGVGLHALLARVVKQAIGYWSPLPRGEQRVAGYDRTVYDSVEAAMRVVAALALLAGAALWFGAAREAVFGWSLGVVLLLAALALDLAQWQRVEVGPEHVWFQRGLMHRVHQVAIENIRDFEVEQVDVQGFSLRRGRDNAIVRLKLRMRDRHVAALPKTGADGSRAAVEAVAQHIGERLASLRAEAAMQPKDPDRKLKRALKRLQKEAAAEPA